MILRRFAFPTLPADVHFSPDRKAGIFDMGGSASYKKIDPTADAMGPKG